MENIIANKLKEIMYKTACDLISNNSSLKIKNNKYICTNSKIFKLFDLAVT